LTRDDLEQILRRIGPLTEAEPVPERAAAAPAVPAQPSAPPGCFDASRGGTRLRVCESIRDSAGGEWTDVSSWYWAALLGRSSGPWWATTVAERTPPGP
jgi:hypothetical protein